MKLWVFSIEGIKWFGGSMVIPKKIHYCWFGKGTKPNSVLKCIETWEKKLNEYEIIEWNEDNFDLNMNEYVRQAYEAKKYAFVTDFVRLYALYNYGGIYFDTDVEVKKNLDTFLFLEGFTGFENKKWPITATLASEAQNEVIGELLEYYKEKSFIVNNKIDTTTNTFTITKIFSEKYNVKLNGEEQKLKGTNFKIYPVDYFCAKDHRNGKVTCTKNTYTIHNFSCTWLPSHIRLKHKIAIFIKNILPIKIVNKVWSVD